MSASSIASARLKRRFSKTPGSGAPVHDVASRAAAGVTWPDGAAWVGSTDMTFIDYLNGDKLNDIKKGILPCLPSSGHAMTAGETAKNTLDNFFTIVLATVKAGAWRASWAYSLVGIVCGCYPQCAKLTMLAIKGGPACDCEVEFIIRLMAELGAQVEKSAVPQASGKYLLWRWWVGRPGITGEVGRMMVSMYQYQKVEYARPDLLESDFWASCDYVETPKLARVAIVSAPVVGPPLQTGLKWRKLGEQRPARGNEVRSEGLASGLRTKLEFEQSEWDSFGVANLAMDDFIQVGSVYYQQEGSPVAEMFNDQIGKCLSLAQRRAELRGFRPEMEIVNGESNMDKYMQEYGVYAAQL